VSLGLWEFFWPNEGGPVNVVGKPPSPFYQQTVYRTSWRLNYNGCDFSGAVETQPHFVGRYQPTQYARFNYNFSGCDVSQPQSETNVHFVGKYRPTKYASFAYNFTGCDFSAPQPETNVSFVGKYQPVKYNLLPSLWRNQSTEAPNAFVTETNPHFIGKYQPTRYSSFAYNFTGCDFTTAQPETNPHFVGKYRLTRYSAFAYNFGCEFSGPLGVQPETNTHFVPRYTPTKYSIFNYNLHSSATS